MQSCKHEWQEMQGTLIYRCVHCGLFMRVEK
jgi:hypothetical protein